MSQTIYDHNEYYDSDGKASRLASILNPLLNFLDKMKAHTFIKKMGLQSGPVLDIGAGDGKFLYHMRSKGMEPYGTSASQISCDAAKRLFDVDLHYTMELPEQITQRQYDAISYWHVFEHLEKPEEHVKQWKAMLKPGAKVMIEVPNVGGLGSKLNFDAWLGSDIKHHINHMTQSEIETMLSKYGLKTDRVEYFSLKFSYVFLWSALLGACFGRKYHFDSVFSLLKDPVNMLRKKPIFTINGLAAVVYMAPVILLLIGYGLLSKQGEVLKMYIEPQ